MKAAGVAQPPFKRSRCNMARVDDRTRKLQEQSTRLVLKFSEDPKDDIANERRKATFPVEELLYHLNGGKEKIERRYSSCPPQDPRS